MVKVKNKKMSNNWETKTLEDLCVIKTGKKDVNQGNPEGKYPFFTCARKNTFSDSYSFDCEAILIAGNGEVGICHYYNGKFEAYQRTYVLSDFAEFIDVQFLFYFVEGKLRDEFRDKKLGNSMPYIRVGMLKDIKVPIPPLSEQKRIVKILDDKFEALEKLKNVTVAQLADAKELFKSELDFTFRNLGGDCKVSRFEDLVKSTQIGLVRSKAEQSSDKEYQYLKMDSIGNGNTYLEKNLTKVDASQEDVKKYALHKGDFLFNTRNSVELVGKNCLYTPSSEDEIVLFNNNIMRVSFKSDVLPEYIHYFFSFPKTREELEKIKSGTTNVAAIYFKDLKNLNIFYPDVNRQREIVSELNKLKVKTDQLSALLQLKIADIEELKKTYLEQAFSGKL